MSVWQTVFKKELRDALRDRKTLLMVILSSVAIGPLVLVMLSAILSDIESRAEKRELYIAGIEHSPTLNNFIQRQTFTVKTPPADYEAQLRKSSFSDPVLVIPNDFESKLAKGEAPEVVIVSDSGNRNASVGVGRIRATLRGFSEERTTLELASRGIARTSLKVLDIEEHNLANASARSAQLTNMLPFFLILAILYGALNAALDTTAGERERGSLEPLLTNPASAWSIVLGKWGAVATVGVMIAILSALSFFPGQWLLQSETLQAMFQYGAREAVLFIIVLIPLAASMSALLMAVAIRCKTFKEAQASNTIVILAFSLLPMFSLMNSTGEKAWHLALPGLAQNIVMNRILKNEPLDALTLGLPPLVALVITVVCLTFVARSLKAAAVK